jgi:hypothetical protein
MEYILTNFMLYVRGNFKNVTMYIWQYIHILHLYSVCGAFQFARKKILHLREEVQHMTIVRIFFYLSLKYNSYFHNMLWFYKH